MKEIPSPDSFIMNYIKLLSNNTNSSQTVPKTEEGILANRLFQAMIY